MGKSVGGKRRDVWELDIWIVSYDSYMIWFLDEFGTFWYAFHGCNGVRADAADKSLYRGFDRNQVNHSQLYSKNVRNIIISSLANFNLKAPTHIYATHAISKYDHKIKSPKESAQNSLESARITDSSTKKLSGFFRVFSYRTRPSSTVLWSLKSVRSVN